MMKWAHVWKVLSRWPGHGQSLEVMITSIIMTVILSITNTTIITIPSPSPQPPLLPSLLSPPSLSCPSPYHHHHYHIINLITIIITILIILSAMKFQQSARPPEGSTNLLVDWLSSPTHWFPGKLWLFPKHLLRGFLNSQEKKKPKTKNCSKHKRDHRRAERCAQDNFIHWILDEY